MSQLFKQQRQICTMCTSYQQQDCPESDNSLYHSVRFWSKLVISSFNFYCSNVLKIIYKKKSKELVKLLAIVIGRIAEASPQQKQIYCCSLVHSTQKKARIIPTYCTHKGLFLAHFYIAHYFQLHVMGMKRYIQKTLFSSPLLTP